MRKVRCLLYDYQVKRKEIAPPITAVEWLKRAENARTGALSRYCCTTSVSVGHVYEWEADDFFSGETYSVLFTDELCKKN
jgi:hypothetical protein